MKCKSAGVKTKRVGPDDRRRGARRLCPRGALRRSFFRGSRHSASRPLGASGFDGKNCVRDGARSAGRMSPPRGRPQADPGEPFVTRRLENPSRDSARSRRRSRPPSSQRRLRPPPKRWNPNRSRPISPPPWDWTTGRTRRFARRARIDRTGSAGGRARAPKNNPIPCRRSAF